MPVIKNGKYFGFVEDLLDEARSDIDLNQIPQLQVMLEVVVNK